MGKTLFVVFGVTGDLFKKKLLKAFEEIYLKQKDFLILGVGRKNFTDKTFQFIFKNDINKDFKNKILYEKIDFDNFEDYVRLNKRIQNIISKDFQVIYYLSVPPTLFNSILRNIKKSKLNNSWCERKIVFEKPFGSDLISARQLNNLVLEDFKEDQIYRIDHYLGKEVIQNFLTLRFANSFFEPIWNNHYIDNIQITAFEEIGIEQRAGYYEKAGALRDMVQNHLLQIFSLIAMEAPSLLDAEKIRDEKIKVLTSIKKFPDNFENYAIFGQYDKNEKMKIKSYLQEKDVSKFSKTETFVALKINVENWRWDGVPFFLRTGKRMNWTGTEVVIEFKEIPNILFNKLGQLKSNKLIIKIQPDSFIKFQFNIKNAKKKDSIVPIKAEFDHRNFFKINSTKAYTTLLLDIINSDQTNFPRWDFVQQSWKIVDKLINCKGKCPFIFKYESFSCGPKESLKLLNKYKKNWNDGR